MSCIKLYWIFSCFILLVHSSAYNDYNVSTAAKHNGNDRNRRLLPFYLSNDGKKFTNRKLFNGTYQYSGWRLDKLSIYYTVNNCSATRLDCATVDSLTFYAIKRWLQVIYNFDIWFDQEQRKHINYERNYPVMKLPKNYPLGNNDLLINITFTSGYHNDAYPFDGHGHILGHAYFPVSFTEGVIHLDSDEYAKDGERKIGDGYESVEDDNLLYYSTLLHEFGHVLGLVHSSNSNSTMRSFYKSQAIDSVIDDETAKELLDVYNDYMRWAKYGNYQPFTPPPLPVKPTKMPTTTTTTTISSTTTKRTTPRPQQQQPSTTSRPPSIACNITFKDLMLNYYTLPIGNIDFDHILLTFDNILFIKGSFVWVMDKSSKKINSGYPISIKDLFDFNKVQQSISLYNGIDAIIQTRSYDFLIFIDDKIFKFNSEYILYDKYPISFGKNLGYSNGDFTDFKVKQVQKLSNDNIIYVFGESFFMLFDSAKDDIVRMTIDETQQRMKLLCQLRKTPIY